MLNQSQHLVFGAGLIGGYLAGGLLNAGLKTSLVARKSVQDAMADGLTISDFLGNQTILNSPQFIDSTNNLELRFKFLWLTVKCTAVRAVCKELENFISKNTIIICCQNGLDSDQIIKQAFPNNLVLKAIVGFNVAEPEAGHLHRSTDGKLVIEFNQHTNELAERLNSVLLPTTISDQMLAEQWAKLQLNLANPVNALADIPVKAMTEDAGYRRIIAELMLELLAVSDAMQLELPKVTAAPAHWIPRLMLLPNWVFKLLAQKMLAIDPTARASMWWDLTTGRKTEIDYLNAAVVDKGNSLGIDCPVNRNIVELIRLVEDRKNNIGISAKNLTSLLFKQPNDA